MKIKKNLKYNKGSAILIALMILTLISLIIFSFSNIYINKIKSINNLNQYYDVKIKEALDNRYKEKIKRDE